MVIMAIAFLLFGGKKLPEIGAGLGKGISAFKKGLREADEEVQAPKQVIAEAKKEIEGVKEESKLTSV